MKQKLFTFKFYKHEIHPKGSVATDALTHAESLKRRLVKKGYMVTNLKEEEVVFVSCYMAKANIPLKGREKMQDKIDKNPVGSSSVYMTSPKKIKPSPK